MRSTDYRVLEHAALALEVLKKPRTRHELAAALGLDPRATHRLLQTLARLGWVQAAGFAKRAERGRPATQYVATVRMRRVR